MATVQHPKYVRNSFKVGVLVVSDSVHAGKREDTSGVNLVRLLKKEEDFNVISIEKECVPDVQEDIENVLKSWADDKKVDLILTTGGTGFAVRDLTPEATRAVIQKEAPHIAVFMIMKCCEYKNIACLSRSVCGLRGESLILNLPGSAKGSAECYEKVSILLPHALEQLKGEDDRVAATHAEIQKD